MLAAGKLPHQLKLLLSNPNVLKVGRMVDADLKHLQNACNSSVPFVGGLDLATLAKERLVVPNAKCSLADLYAIMLNKRLSKATAIRVSEAWEDTYLSQEMCKYAALLIYHKLSQIQPPLPLPEILLPRTPIILYNDSSRAIARGHISDHFYENLRVFEGIKITAKRTVVDITEPLIPGAIITIHAKKSLQSFGKPPFSLVCLHSHLRLSGSSETVLKQESPRLHSSSSSDENNQTMTNRDTDWADPDSDPSVPTGFEDKLNSELDDELEGPSIGSLVLDQFDPVPPLSNETDPSQSTPNSTPSQRCQVDANCAAKGQSILGNQPIQWTAIRSRVLKDPFHVFNMFYISVSHGLRLEFSRALRDALFIPDKEDKSRISTWGATQDPPVSFDDLVRLRPAWVWKHCKRVISPPEELYPLVKNVFNVYGPLKDAKTGLPLFNTAAWKTAKNILVLIQKGYLSDPPGVALYSVLRLDAVNGGLPIYRCA